MKVNYKTHPILEKLEKKSLGNIPCLGIDSHFFVTKNGLDMLQQAFKRDIHYFKEITYLSQEFINASTKASSKLASLYHDITTNNTGDIDVNGTFIHGDNVFFVKHKIRKDIEFQETTFFVFNKNGTPLAFYDAGVKDMEGVFGWVSNIYYYHDELSSEFKSKGVEKLIFEALALIVLASMFKSFASVETRYISAKSNSISGLRKYQNGTNLGITYLTSKWFTNLVRSEGFSVRGHFRLQPKKVNGEWTKELIWIDTFEKHGYTHKAQILSEKNNSSI